MSIILAPHQIEAIKKLHNGCILCGGVGSGKSRAALAYYYIMVCGGSMKTSMIREIPLYIITTAKKRDSLEWESECENVGIKNFYVDSWNNIGKYINVSNAFFIFDEQRVVGYGTWSKSFIKIARKNRWILLTATPGDTWSDYCAVFIANGFHRNKTEFEKRHVVYSRFVKYPKIEKYIDTEYLIQCRKKILISMPHEKKTVRHQHWIKHSYDEGLYSMTVQSRFNFELNKPYKSISELCQAYRKICNTSEEKIIRLKEIVKSSGKAIIFYNYDYELEILKQTMTEINMPYTQWNGHKHEEVPKGKEWVYLVQYNAGAEGWNCITTDTIIFFSLNYSYKMVEQACGRIDRMNTKFIDLHYWFLYTDSSIDKAIINALKKKENFNEQAFVNSQK